MTATLSMVPVAQIRPSKANPRAEFDDPLVFLVYGKGRLGSPALRPTKPPRKTGSLVHAGGCEEQRGSTYDQAESDEEALDQAA